MAYWLMKSEPDAYSIDDLERDGRGTAYVTTRRAT
jgi:predicted RNA-binding protein with PUA-like domain